MTPMDVTDLHMNCLQDEKGFLISKRFRLKPSTGTNVSRELASERSMRAADYIAPGYEFES